MLMMLATRSLAEKHPVSEDSPVVVNYCNPGLCQTTIYRDDGSWLMAKSVEIVLGILARPCEVGARTLVNCVVLSGKESHGKFVNNDKPSKSSSYVEGDKGRQMQKRFWDELMTKLDSICPGVSQNA
jgi:retinol dehydrogenase 12